MTFLVEGTHSHFLGTTAELVDSEVTQSAWASKHITSNPALKWVVAKYIEANNPNRNGQMWQLNDLRMARPTIAHAPMNVDHRANYIIGTFVDSEMMYPTSSDAAENQFPYIEVVGCIWKAYASKALDDIERAYEAASLFTSMECVAESVTCASEGACGQTFPYAGPWSDTYCDCMQHPGRIQQMNNPHFLAGAMILPPNRPGWGGAEVKAIAALVKQYADDAEKIYAAVSAEAPHLDSKDWEARMLAILQQSHTPETPQKRSHLAIAKQVVLTKA